MLEAVLLVLLGPGRGRLRRDRRRRGRLPPRPHPPDRLSRPRPGHGHGHLPRRGVRERDLRRHRLRLAEAHRLPQRHLVGAGRHPGGAWWRAARRHHPARRVRRRLCRGAGGCRDAPHPAAAGDGPARADHGPGRDLPPHPRPRGAELLLYVPPLARSFDRRRRWGSSPACWAPAGASCRCRC